MTKGKVKKGGAALAHIGFGLIILGSLLSAGHTDIISKNRTPVNIKFDDNKDANEENIMLIKGDTVLMDPYYVTYTNRRVEGKFVYFDMDYLKVNEKGKYEKQFSLNPFVQLNDQMGNVPEPSTKHFWDRDIFTHITYADLNNLDSASQEEYREPDTLYMNVGDSVFISNSILRFKSLLRNVEKDSLDLLADDIALGINIEAQTLDGKTYQASPIMVIRGNRVFSIDDEIEELGVKISFSGVKPEEDKLEILISEKNKNAGDFVIMQALVFPYINVLWIGCIIMVLGTLVAAINRFQSRQKKDK